MKAGTKVVLGLLGLGVVVGGLVLASSGSGKIVRVPPASNDGAPAPEGSSAPVQPSSELTGLPFNVWKQSKGNLLEVTDARRLLTWVLEQARDLDIGKLTSAKTAVTKIANRIADGGINRVAFEQIPGAGFIPFAEITKYAKNIPWGTIGPIAKAWLSERGVG